MFFICPLPPLFFCLSFSSFVLDFSSSQQIKIANSEGKIVPVNTPGEICMRGYCVMMGYWGEKEQTEKAVGPTGWLHSG